MSPSRFDRPLIPTSPRVGKLSRQAHVRKALAGMILEGRRLHDAGRLHDALPLYQRVLEIEPRNPAALHYAALLGRQLNDLARANGRPHDDNAVLNLMAASVAAAPENAAAVHNFAKFLHDRGKLEDAKQLYENAVAINPAQGESWTNLGNIYGEFGNRMRAEACWIRALECSTGAADSRFNLSFLKLLKGDYAGGWRDYEARWECPEFAHAHGRPELTAPRWAGSQIPGTLYLHGEQGAGDAIMMARYVPLVRPRVGRLVVEVIRGLVPLFRAMFPELDVVAKGDDPPPMDAHLPMMSLPTVFETTLETIPESPPFWPSDANGAPIQPESWRIGLCWRGSTTHVNDRTRSMPFEATFPLLDLAGPRWQSLQFGYETSPPLDPLPLGDFLDTAREIARCSLVITVDTSICHLAGSMGVPTWLLVPANAEWRWLQDRNDSPWYPSMTVWRQEIAGDWNALIARVAEAVSTRISLNHDP